MMSLPSIKNRQRALRRKKNRNRYPSATSEANFMGYYTQFLNKTSQTYNSGCLADYFGEGSLKDLRPLDYYTLPLSKSVHSEETVLMTQDEYLRNRKEFSFQQHFLCNYETIKEVRGRVTRDEFDVLSKKRYLPASKKPLLLLDLDETLVHSGDWDPKLFESKICFRGSGGSMAEVGVNIRPHLSKFLEIASNMFDLGIFTASSTDYAKKVVSFIDPSNLYFETVFTRDHCLDLGNNEYVKDLLVVGNRPRDSVFLVDNSSVYFSLQPDNGIPILPYYSDPKDDQLMRLAVFLLYLRTVPAPGERRMFLRNYFKNFLFLEKHQVDEFFNVMFV